MARQSTATRRALRTTLHYAVLVLIALVCAFPFLWTLSVAIGSEGNVFDFPSSLLPHTLSLANFVEVFRVIELGRYFWNSLWITLWTVVWTVMVCSLAAYPLARLEFRGRRLVFTVILATLMLPTEVNFLVNFITTSQLRLVNTYAGVILPTLAGAIGIFMMKNAFEEIPQDLLDAARIDGASELHIFFRIMSDGAATDRRADHPDDGDDLEQFPVAERRAHQERADAVGRGHPRAVGHVRQLHPGDRGRRRSDRRAGIDRLFLHAAILHARNGRRDQ
jgi:ABC-type spermidine/putrescine transport system permease subunit II